ncbi:SIMPL domain-containing protein [Oceanobacillus chungangensis]|uniref:SIMPL domain-containing protein n=1 Tax=Oceanobacillus chungangensis TaxID=1229152 RepID=A0A3D8PUD7_9BACI|nr:SIMPL domain-containing protein [Oceanobacillus chungangensis]RDW19736.1 hypothetical protein CWR45_06575 [Oceanobacillus chungangensis]
MYYPYQYPTNTEYRQAQHQSQARRVMTVTGNGQISVEPNIVTVQLEVVTENESLRLAQQENASKMNQVIQALLNMGVSRENIHTTTFTVFPRYDFVDGKQVFRGYEVTNGITVEISALDQAGAIIDEAVKNGVNRVSNIQFSVRDKDIYYQQALSAALENANGKAEAIARTMQLNLNQPPIKIIEQTTGAPPTTYKVMAASAESFATPIEPGQIMVHAAVEVQYQY